MIVYLKIFFFFWEILYKKKKHLKFIIIKDNEKFKIKIKKIANYNWSEKQRRSKCQSEKIFKNMIHLKFSL